METACFPCIVFRQRNNIRRGEQLRCSQKISVEYTAITKEKEKGVMSSKDTDHSPENGECPVEGGQPDRSMENLSDDEKVKRNMQRIAHKILVLSGKGGVGKSTVAVNLAIALALEGKRVGLLDVDFHGPSIPTLLHLEGRRPQATETGLLPILIQGGMKVMSLGFLLAKPEDAVIWRGPLKIHAIKQLLGDVEWGDLDYLVIDFPPGTGDEPLTVAQTIPEADGAVVVTTPQDVSTIDVSKSVTFCRQLNIPVLGVIENMSGLICPHCSKVIDLFKQGGGEAMARRMEVPFLGRVPLDPQIVISSDEGKPFIYYHQNTEAAAAFKRIVEPLLDL
jgi:Mrp family chromosome partitioning ATPase